MLDVVRARRLVAWATPHHVYEAKTLDPDEPSLGSLAIELGEQLGAALEVIDSLLRAPPG